MVGRLVDQRQATISGGRKRLLCLAQAGGEACLVEHVTLDTQRLKELIWVSGQREVLGPVYYRFYGTILVHGAPEQANRLLANRSDVTERGEAMEAHMRNVDAFRRQISDPLKWSNRVKSEAWHGNFMSDIERRPVKCPPIWEDALKSSHDAVIAETTYSSDDDKALPDGGCADDREDTQVGIVKLRSIRGLDCHDAERCMDMIDQ